MRLSIVIPNYNGKHLLDRNLPVVIKTFPATEIIIVDDASTDTSISYLKKKYPKIKLVEKVTNSGFATTVNLGVKAAQGDIVLLLNSDAVPKINFSQQLFKDFSNEKVFAVGCLEESIEQGETVLRGSGEGSFTRGFLMHKLGDTNAHNTLWANGGSSAFRKDLWEKLGGMDEMYDPFYWEDIDLSYRAQKSGYRIIFDQQCVVEHRHEEGSIKTQFSETDIKRIAYRNQFIFVWKNITDAPLLLNHVFWLPYHKFKALLSFDWPFFQGLFSAVTKLPKIWHKRQAQKLLYKVADNQVLSQKL